MILKGIFVAGGAYAAAMFPDETKAGAKSIFNAASGAFKDLFFAPTTVEDSKLTDQERAARDKLLAEKAARTAGSDETSETEETVETEETEETERKGFFETARRNGDWVKGVFSDPVGTLKETFLDESDKKDEKANPEEEGISAMLSGMLSRLGGDGKDMDWMTALYTALGGGGLAFLSKMAFGTKFLNPKMALLTFGTVLAATNYKTMGKYLGSFLDNEQGSFVALSGDEPAKQEDLDTSINELAFDS